MNSPTNREVADEIVSDWELINGDALPQRFRDDITSALAAAESRGRAAGEADMRERAAAITQARLDYARLHSAQTGAMKVRQCAEAIKNGITALPLSAPAKQEGSDAT